MIVGRTGVADFDSVMALNFGGVLNTTKAFLPLLNPEGGRVVNISSGAASMFIQNCSEENQASLLLCLIVGLTESPHRICIGQAFFLNPDVTLEDIAKFFATMKKIGAANPEGTAELEEASNKAFKVPIAHVCTRDAARASFQFHDVYSVLSRLRLYRMLVGHQALTVPAKLP